MDPTKFDFDRDMTAVDDKEGATVNSLSADLSKFRRHGGKLIMFHGWADTVVSPYDSIVYFDRVNGLGAPSENGSREFPSGDFSRLFMVAGMSHCGGGAAPNDFGQSAAPDQPGNPDNDIVAALDQWVVKGVAPEKLIAKRSGNGPPGQATPTTPATRPICAYPRIPVYDGTGDPDHAESFSCKSGPEGKVEFPAPRYMR
jgi:feruloyl esterase